MSVTLSQLIDQVREELLLPRQASTPEAMYPLLFVEEVELEIGVTISSGVEGSGKVNVQVVELSSGVDKSNEQTHRVKIKLTPLLSKDEIREQLKQSNHTWERTRQTGLQGTAKDFPNMQ